ncbi:MAG: hypothetical protein ACTH0V_00280 [Microbacteriaceae bacterium]
MPATPYAVSPLESFVLGHHPDERSAVRAAYARVHRFLQAPAEAEEPTMFTWLAAATSPSEIAGLADQLRCTVRAALTAGDVIDQDLMWAVGVTAACSQRFSDAARGLLALSAADRQALTAVARAAAARLAVAVDVADSVRLTGECAAFAATLERGGAIDLARLPDVWTHGSHAAAAGLARRVQEAAIGAEFADPDLRDWSRSVR